MKTNEIEQDRFSALYFLIFGVGLVMSAIHSREVMWMYVSNLILAVGCLGYSAIKYINVIK